MLSIDAMKVKNIVFPLLVLFLSCTQSNPVVQTTVNQSDLLGPWVRLIRIDHVNELNFQGGPSRDTSFTKRDTAMLRILNITDDTLEFYYNTKPECYDIEQAAYQLNGNSFTGAFSEGNNGQGYSWNTTVALTGDTLFYVVTCAQVSATNKFTEENIDKFIKYVGPLPPASWNKPRCPE